MTDLPGLMKALQFASLKHRDQRRKGDDAAPYINHPIDVTDMLVRVGQVTDAVVLQSALLHDTIEDTPTTAQEIEDHFGPEVRSVVLEVTDDKSLPKDVRKRLQIEHAPHLSRRAQLVKLADKISNVKSIGLTPPEDWPLERQTAYLDWTANVVAGLRGCNFNLEELYDELLAQGHAAIAARRAKQTPHTIRAQ